MSIDILARQSRRAPLSTASMDGINIADERQRFRAMIQKQVQNSWYIPPGNESRVVRLRLEILPTAKLRSVEVVERGATKEKKG